MGTLELIVVFSALMVLVALVSIGIDWIGKPLRNKRFIPRIYRFDDEKLPVDHYGNTVAPAELYEVMAPHHAAAQAAAAMPTVDPRTAAAARPVVAPDIAPEPRLPTEQPQPLVVAKLPTDVPTNGPTGLPTQLEPNEPSVAPVAHSAFSDSLAGPEPASGAPQERTGQPPPRPAPSEQDAPNGRVWLPGMALDATVDDRKPNLATKAARFWQTTGQAAADTHFDESNLERMASGKAPRRTNPRTGRPETMQLTGLRQASDPSQVRMGWPDDAVDPWNPA